MRRRRGKAVARILLMTFGSRGDVQPYVALGHELENRGHAVTLCTASGFDDLMAGLSYRSLSMDIEAMLHDPNVQAGMKSLRGLVRAFRSSQAMMQQQLDEMWQAARDVAPNIIVYHPKAFPAPYFARMLDAVAIPSFLQPAFVPTGGFPNPVVRLPSLGRLGNRTTGSAFIRLMRFGYGSLLDKWFPRHTDVQRMPRLDPIAGYHPGGRPVPRLHAHSACVVPGVDDWGENDHVTGYWFASKTSDWRPSPDLAAFLAAGAPPIYIGFGSMPSIDGEETTRAVLKALHTTGQRAILATGWGGLSAEEMTADAQIHVLSAAPHDGLFPQCQAVVHHGGAGTTHAGLRWGRPTLVCALFGDQPFWGRQVARLGAGPAPLSLKALNANQLASALKRLEDPQIAAAAQQVGNCIAAEDGVVRAVDLIEEVIPPGTGASR